MYSRYLESLFIVICILFMSCGALAQAYPIRSIPEELSSNSNAVVRYKYDHFSLDARNNLVSEHEVVVSLLNPRANYHNYIQIGYQEGISKISDIKLEIFDSKGKKIKTVKAKSFSDQAIYSDISMATDSRMLFYNVSNKNYPYTIKYSYSKKSKFSAFVPHFYAYYGEKTSVEEAHYTLAIPKELLVHKVKNIERYEKHLNLDELPNRLSIHNMPWCEFEKSSPYFMESIPTVLFNIKQAKLDKTYVAFENWKDYGDWMYSNYLKTNMDISEETKSIVSGLIEDKNTNLEKAKSIYEYVVNSTRYISIQLGEGGLEPFPSQATHEKKYGDCKALSLYSLSLMKAAGIPAFYTVIEANSDYAVDFEKDFASLSQGNHIIIGIPIEKDTIWADCTSSHIPFGSISSFTDGRLAVAVTESGGKLVKTDKYSDSENITVREIKGIFNSNKIDLEVKSQFQGKEMTLRPYLEKQNEDDLKRKIIPSLYPSFSEENISNISFSKLNDTTYMEKLQLTNLTLGNYAGDYLIIPIHIFSGAERKLNLDRKQDIYIKDGYSKSYTYEYELHSKYTLAEEQPKISFQNNFGSISCEINLIDNNLIQIHTQIHTFSGRFDAQQVVEYNEWLNQLGQFNNQEIILKPL